MSLSSDRMALARAQKAIADLRTKDAAEAQKEVSANGRANAAAQAASKTTSLSSAQSKIREAERYQKAAADCSKKRAKIATDLARKTTELNRLQERVSKSEDMQRKQDAKQIQDLTRRLTNQKRSFQSELEGLAGRSHQVEHNISLISAEYDVFISHASEDKDEFVRDFARALKERGLTVWYDEHSLKWGDSLRREIDKGLAASRFGVVVLSKHFFAKEWPQTELDGLMSKELAGEGRILPIWHNISKDAVLKASPILGNKLAMNTAMQTVHEIADELQKLCAS